MDYVTLRNRAEDYDKNILRMICKTNAHSPPFLLGSNLAGEGQETQNQSVKSTHPPAHMIIGLRVVIWPKPSQWESTQRLELK